MFHILLAQAAAQPAAAPASLSDALYAALAALIVPAATAVLTVSLHHLSVWAASKFPWLSAAAPALTAAAQTQAAQTQAAAKQ